MNNVFLMFRPFSQVFARALVPHSFVSCDRIRSIESHEDESSMASNYIDAPAMITDQVVGEHQVHVWVDPNLFTINCQDSDRVDDSVQSGRVASWTEISSKPIGFNVDWFLNIYT